MQEPIDSSAATLESKDNGTLFSSANDSTSTPAFAPSNFKPFDFIWLCKTSRDFVMERAKHVFVQNADPYMIKAAEGAFSEDIRLSFESADKSCKHASFHFMKTVSTEMACNGSPNDLYERYIEHRTQPSTFGDAITHGAPTFFRFVRAVAMFIRKKVKKKTYALNEEKLLSIHSLCKNIFS